MSAREFFLVVTHPDGREFVCGRTTDPDRAATLAVCQRTAEGWSTVRRFRSFGDACDFCAKQWMVPANTAIISVKVIPVESTGGAR